MTERMERYNVIVSAGATQMLVFHAAFLARVNEAAAERLVTAFEEAAHSLEKMPQRRPWLTGAFIPRKVYRKLLFEDRYLMLFQIADGVVYVDYVVDCRQDYAWLMK